MSDRLAFIDESGRSGRYLLCVVVVDPAVAGRMRRTMRQLLLPGQRRLHFKKESPRRRRQLLEAVGYLDLDATVYECAVSLGRDQEGCRAACLRRAVADLQLRGHAINLLIEGRDGLDQADRAVLQSARRTEPPLSFEHVLPGEEPLLWLPDLFAWSVGARGDWLRRARPLLSGGVIEVV